MLDLHRHGEASSFDGFGKAVDLARLAKRQGLTALGLSDHGTMTGLVDHWKACLENDIKPILGVEAYFQPKFNKKDPKRDSFHLCLFAENLQGYKNLNKIMTIANKEQKYYKPIVDFALLEKYSEGVICTSGCIASFVSQMAAKGNKTILNKSLDKFVEIFGDNFYMEIQPYKLDERTPEDHKLQERVNITLIKQALKRDIKMVLTSDSHFGNRADYPTYMKMHEIGGHADFAGETYVERYMPAEDELIERFMNVHGKDFKNAEDIAQMCIDGLNDIEEKVEMDILGQLEQDLPKVSKNSAKLLQKNIIKGLKDKGKFTKKYIERCKEEYEVIVHHGFEDYFLIVQDYSLYAKREYGLVDEKTAKGWNDFIKLNNYPEASIKMGPGRGSVCNSAMAYALGITDVDAVFFDLDFTRFLRLDKKKLPDIDLDFETDRRAEIIKYIVDKYGGQAAQICSYGLYKVDNLLNDLAKVCGVGRTEIDEKGKEKFIVDKGELKEIKDYINKHLKDDEFDYDTVSRKSQTKMYNKLYDDIIIHFSKMYKKMRYTGTHAAGVAIVGGDLLDYTSIETKGSKDKGTYAEVTAYDLNNLEAINAIKFDILGLRTLSITKELEEMTGECFSYEWLEDEEVYDYFRQGKTDGVFQFEKNTAKGILRGIETDSFKDVVAASALNRPGPLSLKMPDQYASNKISGDYGNEPWSDFTNKTYGTIVYQEQITAICREVGMMTHGEADKVLKFMKGGNSEGLASAVEGRKKEEEELRNIFIKGAMKTRGLTKQQGIELFDRITVYSFNEGHSTGYSIISLEQMYYKVHHPEQFWYTTLKYAANEGALATLKVEAVKEGNIILLPHVNYGAKYQIVNVEGESALAEGLSNIKNVGAKAAEFIEKEKLKNGRFKNKEDFMERIKVPKTPVNVGVIKALEEVGALVFNKKVYFERVQKYNSTLYMKGMR